MKIVISIIFSSIWIVMGTFLIRAESPTFDEPVHLQAAIEYSQGNYNFDPIEPPLLRRLGYLLSHDLSDIRLYFVILTGLLLVYLCHFELNLSIFPLGLVYVFLLLEPTILAHSHYFTTDAISSILVVITMYRVLQQKFHTPREQIVTLIFTWFALSSKVATLPLVALVYLIRVRHMSSKYFPLAVISSLLFVWGTYNFRLDNILTKSSFVVPLGGYLRAIKENILFALRGQEVYFMGTPFIKGPWFKSILVLLLKFTPVTLVGLWLSIKSKNPLALIGIICLLFNSLKSLQFGSRHLLPAILSIGILSVVQLYQYSKLTLYSLLTVSVLSLALIWPHPITYQNFTRQLFPKYPLTDSDFDWGQGLYSLRDYIHTHQINHFQLAYFGNYDPLPILGPYWRIEDASSINTLPISKLQSLPTFISVTCYYKCRYYLDKQWDLNKATLIKGSFLYFATPPSFASSSFGH